MLWLYGALGVCGLLGFFFLPILALAVGLALIALVMSIVAVSQIQDWVRAVRRETVPDIVLPHMNSTPHFVTALAVVLYLVVAPVIVAIGGLVLAYGLTPWSR